MRVNATITELLKFEGKEFTLRDVRDEIFKGNAITNKFLGEFNELVEKGVIVKKITTSLPRYFIVNPEAIKTKESSKKGKSRKEKVSNNNLTLDEYVKSYLKKKNLNYEVTVEDGKIFVIIEDTKYDITNKDKKGIRRFFRKLLKTRK